MNTGNIGRKKTPDASSLYVRPFLDVYLFETEVICFPAVHAEDNRLRINLLNKTMNFHVFFSTFLSDNLLPVIKYNSTICTAKEKETKITSNVKFVKAILVPRDRKAFTHRPMSTDFILRYKAAWEKHDLKILRDLFTNDALYQEKKDQAPFVGIDSICSYWAHNAIQQSQVTFSQLFVSEKDKNIGCIWTCDFYRRDLMRWMILNGEFLAEKEENKLSFFRETFKKCLRDDKKTPDFVCQVREWELQPKYGLGFQKRDY